MWNMERIGLTSSDEKSLENVDGRMNDGRADGRRIPVYNVNSPMSFRLR